MKTKLLEKSCQYCNHSYFDENGNCQYCGAPPAEMMKVRGFFRVQIDDRGEILGDSGWMENIVVNEGFRDYLCRLIAAQANSKQISHLALGTGGLPGAASTSIAGEVENRQAVTAATSSDSKTIRFTGTFASGNSFVTTTEAISNIGLFHTSAGGTLFAGNTYNSSNVATNQNVNNWRQLLETAISKLRKFAEHLFETIASQAPCSSTLGLAWGRV